MSSRLEYQLIVGWIRWLHEEDLNERAGGFVEVKSGLYHTCVVGHHEHTRMEMSGQIVEHVLTHLSFVVDEQLAVVARNHGKLCYPLIGEIVVVIAYLYMFCIHCPV